VESRRTLPNMENCMPKQEHELTLYGYFRSSTAYRARIALNLKGLSYEQVSVHLLRDGGEQHLASYRAINPQMRVPSLVVADGLERHILIQSGAIIEWLDEAYPAPRLLPDDSFARARCRAVAAIIGCDIHPLNNLVTLNYLKERFGRGKEDVDDWYAHWIREGFAAVEQLIEPSPFAFGRHPTIADLYLVPQLYNARRFSVPLDPFPRIRAAADACASLEAFSKAAPENQADAA